MEVGALTEGILVGGLLLIMFGMGLDLRTADFRRVIAEPAGLGVGSTAQLLLPPALGFAIAALSGLPGELAVGLVLIASCPGGAVSNLMTYLARGEVALSVSLTVVANVVTIVSIPLLLNLAMTIFMGSDALSLAVGPLIVRLMLLTLVPLLLGMTLRRVRPAIAVRWEPWVRRLSGGLLGVVILVAIGDNREALPAYAAVLALPLVLLNAGSIAGGWILARAARLGPGRTMTVMIETGVQNGALGITLPAVVIGNAEMAIPPALYGVLMLLSGALLVLFSPLRRAGR